MMAVKLEETYLLSQLKEKMLNDGWKIKDFSDHSHPEKAYRSWYYRIRKTYIISHSWLISHPHVWFYRSIDLKTEEQEE